LSATAPPLPRARPPRRDADLAEPLLLGDAADRPAAAVRGRRARRRRAARRTLPLLAPPALLRLAMLAAVLLLLLLLPQTLLRRPRGRRKSPIRAICAI